MTLSRIQLRLFVLSILILVLFVRRSQGQGIQVTDMAFVDDLHGWVSVMEPSPLIFRTSNGGKTWSRFPLPSKQGFYRMHFFDRNTGIAIAFESDQKTGIYLTDDAGQDWKNVNEIEPPNYTHFLDLTLTSPSEGFLVGEGEGQGYVVQILNGGHTLKVRRDLPVGFAQLSNTVGLFGDGTGHLWIVGNDLILHSSDGGKTWENQYLNTDPKIDLGISGTALPGGHAWITAGDFDIYRTDDYGKHWIRALTTKDQGGITFESISFENPHDGCAVGNSSFIYCTKNGGATWSRSRLFKNYANRSSFFSRLQLFSSSSGWASVNGALYRTRDGGHSFAEVLTTSAPEKSDIAGEFKALSMSINGPTELACDKGDFLFIVESMQDRLLRLDLKHHSIKVVLSEPENRNQDYDYPNAIAVDQQGNLFIADFDGRLRELDRQSGKMRILLDAPAGHSDGPFEVPAEMAVDGEGNIFVVDRHHKLFWWQKQLGKLETVAGAGITGFGGDGGLATNAELNFPMGVAVARNGDIFIADYQNCRIRKIEAKTRTITTIAGNGECASRGDGGPAIQASLNYPGAMALDNAGNLFFVEGGTDRVRYIDAHGTISTYAGTGEKGFSGDGGPATKAALNDPEGVAVDAEGALYISEYVNNRIRRVDPATHIITTVAGNGTPKRLDTLE